MTKFKITRTSEYTNKMRAIEILVDGKRIGTIKDGETKEFETTKGQHTIEAKIDWCGSPKIVFDTDNVEYNNFKLSSYSNNKGLNSIYLLLAIALLHFVLSTTINFHYVAFLLIPSFIFMVYHITIGRNKYLRLNEVNHGI